jgi:hypothetical protein
MHYGCHKFTTMICNVYYKAERRSAVILKRRKETTTSANLFSTDEIYSIEANQFATHGLGVKVTAAWETSGRFLFNANHQF